MYKVIIADDHMPVIDYLTTKIPWQQLGLELIEACSDGEEAVHACKRVTPDILITDIGMPIINGLELIEEGRKINPFLKTVILSCHEDFHFAQRAVKLNVNDYILKETLRIEQLIDILRQLTKQLNEEEVLRSERQKLQTVVFESLSSLGTKFLHSLIEQPIWNETEWAVKAESFGIRLINGTPYLPVLCMLERFSHLEERFGGEHQLQYVIVNALNESVKIEGSVIVTLDERHYYILYPYPKSIKWNLLDKINEELQLIQNSMGRYMKIGTSFYFGESCDTMTELKKQITLLLNAKTFRFYSGENRILKLQHFEITKDDIFVYYAAALDDFKNCILNCDVDYVKGTLAKWIGIMDANRYPMDSVRSWVLKIVTDIELKYTVMQHFLTNYSAELLQQTVYAIDTLDHLSEWLNNFLVEKMGKLRAYQDHTKRKEIVEAQRYVMMHLNEKISMDEMAKRLDLNSSHFSRIFKKETGETFIEFVTRCKMERAREMLDKSNQSVEQISEELGFDNSSYFFKLFRAFSGMSPTEYRKKI
ncbi:helix-turn-helix domain-containing protein [Paenibacillus sp. LMG 31456]|uniref:Helix-turn-helix domain-containing protein n=1 Tax=Paenibacillus foliorum TaxID=2654974 RepID=A0A972H056_9BACL|nr:helix-turn-helix domain-containing protein [Paenibacillus foliorum]NOU97368.1 helix-turn-helix domain-containing protein [Paenibacillus foliorum]